MSSIQDTINCELGAYFTNQADLTHRYAAFRWRQDYCCGSLFVNVIYFNSELNFSADVIGRYTLVLDSNIKCHLMAWCGNDHLHGVIAWHVGIITTGQCRAGYSCRPNFKMYFTFIIYLTSIWCLFQIFFQIVKFWDKTFPLTLLE